jgi:hypothetical protein
MSAVSKLARPIVVMPMFALVAVLASVAVAVHGAAAQGAAGTITGRVLWGPCLRGLPLPMTPNAQGGEVEPNGPGIVDQPPLPGRPGPGPINGLPAGAVLVAVQNTSLSARTDETGRFTLSGVPAGQYLTVAAGPVADSNTAIAERPNVFVNGGQSTDVGILSLGGPSSVGIACRFFPSGPDAAPGTVAPSVPGAPEGPTPPNP